MHLLNPRKSSAQELDSMFSAKYPWLLRWAMHFTQNDRPAAEDLVQETCVRILKLRNKLSNLDDVEPLLYTHLRFAFLTERRRGLSEAFLDATIVNFDTLAISLRTLSSFDQIETQNELRKILAFLLWRRCATKFASFFLFRFFHGLLPAEIANICLVTRHAVDLGLGNVRAELKAYLANPDQIHVLGRGSAPEYKPHRAALPSDDFTNELIESIFRSSYGTCPSNATLERRYRTLNQRPLESDLLAHIVSCKVCLCEVTRLTNTPPPTRSMEESLKPTRRAGKSKRPDSSDQETIARILARAEERVREIFEHRPSGLVIALNAEVVAAHNISSPRAVLKVETRSVETLDMIEVFSEQGMLMLSLEILQRPPQAPPELMRDIALSDDRTLALVVRFTAIGALIEATYLDPHFLDPVAEDELFEDMHVVTELGADGFEIVSGGREDTAAAGTPERLSAQPWWLRCFHRIVALLHARPLVPIAAFGLLLACALLWVTANHQREQIRTTNLLSESGRAERNRRIEHGPGVIHQRVAIRAVGHTLQRDIYRDIDSRRRPKAHPLGSDEQLLMVKLEEAGLDWNDPLSAAGFQAWHDHQPGDRDQMKTTGTGLMTVTTAVSSGPVVRESLTVRLSDLHPVARTLYFRDQETIEVAELSYEVLPWGPASEEWFEPTPDSSAMVQHRPTSLVLPPRPVELSDGEIDMAKLSVLVALQKLNADTERLQSAQTRNGIIVTGIVESEDRKQEIANWLRMIPHVIVDIHSYRDFELKPRAETGITSIRAMSLVAGESPLDQQCATQRVARDRCQQLALLLLNASATLVRESNRLSDLQRQYPPAKSLTPQARALLNELMRLHIDHLATASGEEKKAFPVLGPEHLQGFNGAAGHPVDINNAVQQNLLLTKELVYAGNERSRPAFLIIHDLTISAEEVRTAVSRIPVPTADRAAISSITSTPHHD
jgi:DNA-directed RNA polymerase specialized sigma24 family protein